MDTTRTFEKDLLHGIPTAFGYRTDDNGVYVWRRNEANGVQTGMAFIDFAAAVRDAMQSDFRYISFSTDNPMRVSFSDTELRALEQAGF